MGKIQLDRSMSLDLVVRLAPQYIEMLRDLQSTDHGAKITRKFESMRQRLGLDNYVLLYDDEQRIGTAFMLAFLGEDGFKSFNEELQTLSPEQQQQRLDELLEGVADDDAGSWVEGLLPDTPEKEEEQRRAFELMSEDERVEASRRAAFFWSGFYANFYQYLSVMVTGQKLTDLVAIAKQGDEGAFCKAVQVAPHLLTNHPYFRERHLQAQRQGETNFLKRIGTRLANPGPRGQIRYPGLYMVFAILDALGWLDGGMTHGEMLDLCDEAGLDRYQNRIEDVNFLTKRLGEYRKMQKQARLSML